MRRRLGTNSTNEAKGRKKCSTSTKVTRRLSTMKLKKTCQVNHVMREGMGSEE